jgi:serine/threonine-protein kinase
MALATGSLLAGRYEITAAIATGGMGEVWKARDRVLDRIVAAKVLKSEYTGDPNFLARFRNEARHTAALTHQNIASVYDYGETVDDTGTQQLAFLVMEFVEGQPLVTILHDEGALPVDWTLHVLGQSADGLSAAHRAGVVHRDIKPGNLMVRPDGVVKLTDFGIAQARDSTPLTRTGMVVGTAQYLSPEQAQGLEVTAASDVYSLGVVGFECLAGVRPFDGPSQVAIALAHINRPPPPLPAHVPPAVRLLIERALAKDPADRFPDGAAFAEAIRRVASGGGPAPVVPVVGPPTAPTQALTGAAAAAALGGAAGAALAESRTQVIPATGPGVLAASAAPGGAATGPAGPMPPLQVPSDDDWDDVDADDEPAGGRSRWAWIAVAVLLVLGLAGGAWYVLGDGNRGTGGAAATTSSTQTTGTPTGIQLDPAAFIGHPADEVQATLEAAGLSVTQRDADDAQLAAAGMALAAGDVAGLRPSGVLAPPGTQVVLFVARTAYSPSHKSSAPTTTAPKTTSAPAPTTTASPTTTTPPTTTPSTSVSVAPGTQGPPTSAPANPPVADPAGAPAPGGAG